MRINYLSQAHRILRRTVAFLAMCMLLSLAHAQFAVPPGGAVSLPSGGALNLSCTALDVQGSLALGGGAINLASGVTIGGTGNLNGGSGTISVGGNWTNNGTFNPGTSTVSFIDGCTAALAVIAGTTTFNNLTLSSGSGRTIMFAAGSVVTVNGALNIQGTPGTPLQITGPAGEQIIVRLGPNAQVNVVNANIAPNVQIGNARASVQQIPSLSEWSILLLTLMILVMAMRCQLSGTRPMRP